MTDFPPRLLQWVAQNEKFVKCEKTIDFIGDFAFLTRNAVRQPLFHQSSMAGNLPCLV